MNMGRYRGHERFLATAVFAGIALFLVIVLILELEP